MLHRDLNFIRLKVIRLINDAVEVGRVGSIDAELEKLAGSMAKLAVKSSDPIKIINDEIKIIYLALETRREKLSSNFDDVSSKINIFFTQKLLVLTINSNVKRKVKKL